MRGRHHFGWILWISMMGVFVGAGCISDEDRSRIEHPCDNKEILCGDVCTDTDVDPDHCGECDVRCGDGEVCSRGTCSSQCLMEDEEPCQRGCFDLEVATSHCGQCGNVCGEREVCWDGECRAIECRNVQTWPEPWLEHAEDVVELVNARRTAGATCDGDQMPPVDPLSVHSSLAEAARCHSQDLGRNEIRGHQGSDGSDPGERMHDAGYDWSTYAENAAYGHATAQDVMEAWMASEGHCRNIMRDDVDEIGVGFVHIPGIEWAEYWTLKFARQ